MAQDSTQIVRTGDLLVYIEPYSAANIMPADSAWGTPWGGAWQEKGFTNEGLDINLAITYEDQHVDQLVYPVFTIGTVGDIHLVTRLMQITPQNLQSISGQGSIATVSPTSGVRGHTDLAIDGSIAVNYQTVGYDAKHPGDGEAIRPVLWKALMRGAPQIKLARTAAAVLPLDASGVPDTSNGNRVLTWRDVTPALP